MALAMLCRAGAWWALMRTAAYAAGVGCTSMGCPPAKAAEAELHVVAAKPACLNAAETREMVKSRHLLEPFAALKFAGAQRKAEALSASSAAPERISFTRSPSCIEMGASCMSIWRLGREKSLRARRMSRAKLMNPTTLTNRTNLTRPTSRPSRIDFGGNQG